MKEKAKKEWVYCVFSTLVLYGGSLLFSLFSLIFILDKVPKWLQFVVSFVFIAPTLYIVYVQGVRNGERTFKKVASTGLNDLHNEKGIAMPYYKCVFHVLGFVVPLLLLTVLSVIIKSRGLRIVVMLFEFPVALMFSSVKVLDLANVTPVTLAIFIPYTLLIAGMFVLGYLLKMHKLKAQQGAIRSELRSFDN